MIFVSHAFLDIFHVFIINIFVMIYLAPQIFFPALAAPQKNRVLVNTGKSLLTCTYHISFRKSSINTRDRSLILFIITRPLVRMLRLPPQDSTSLLDFFRQNNIPLDFKRAFLAFLYVNARGRIPRIRVRNARAWTDINAVCAYRHNNMVQ